MADLRGGSTVAGFPVLGRAGNDNYILKFSGNNAINSLIYDDGTNATIGGNLIVSGTFTVMGGVGRVYFPTVDGSNNVWFGTNGVGEPSDLGFGWKTDGSGKIIKVQLSAANNPVVATNNNTLDDSSGNIRLAGSINSVSGQATSGAFGVNTTLISVINKEITSTSAQQVFSFTPTTSGIYSVKWYLRVVTAATTITATLAFADSGGAQVYTPSDLNNKSLAVGSYSVLAYDFEAVTGTPITLTITAGTANQIYVTTALIGIA